MGYKYRGKLLDATTPKAMPRKPRKPVVPRNHNKIILNDSIPPLQPCGTPAAFARHARRGEEACEPCKQAERKRRKETKRKTRERRGGRVWDGN